MISGFMEEGYTLAAAVKRASEQREAVELLRRSMVDRFQGITEIDGYPAIDLGFIDDQQHETLYLVIKENHTDIKIVSQQANHKR